MRHNLKLFLSPFNTETPATTPCLGAAQHVHSHRFRSASVSLHDCFIHQDLRVAKTLHIDGVVNQDRRRQHKEVIQMFLFCEHNPKTLPSTSHPTIIHHHLIFPAILDPFGSFWSPDHTSDTVDFLQSYGRHSWDKASPRVSSVAHWVPF